MAPHHMGMAESQHAHTAGAGYKPTAVAPQPLTFDGYVRPDGRVATRNYLGVIASVNCSATVCRHIADAFKDEALAAFPHVDGVVAITHGSGCGMGGNGEGLALLPLAGFEQAGLFPGVPAAAGLRCASSAAFILCRVAPGTALPDKGFVSQTGWFMAFSDRQIFDMQRVD